MKKILAALLVLALGMPALAVVDITATDAGNQYLLLSFTGPAAAVRGIALTLNVTGGVITAATNYDTVTPSAFNTFIDYAFTTGAGYVIGTGHPFARETLPGVATFPINAGTAFAVSMGYLDEAPAHTHLGLTSGTIAKIKIDGITPGGSATVAISANATRGGAAVGDTLGTVNVQASQVIAGPPIVYNLTTSSTAGGDVTTPGEPGPYPYNASTVVDIVATPDANYHFVNWTGDTANIANVNLASTTITMNANAAIVANFAIDQKTLTTSVGTPSGTVTTPPSSPTNYDYGTVAPICATPAVYYKFVNWTGDTANIANVNLACTTITMNANAAIVANFAKKTCYEMLTAAEKLEYDKYIAAGKTDAQMVSWCWRFQCRGDADNLAYLPTTLKWQIYQGDMNIMIAQWKKTYATSTNVAADFDHMSYLPTTLKWTVYQGDMNIMIANWKKTATTLVECPSYLP